jgi:hypothetical protein
MVGIAHPTAATVASLKLGSSFLEISLTGECEVLPKKLRQNLCKPCYESVSEIVRLEPLSGLEP